MRKPLARFITFLASIALTFPLGFAAAAPAYANEEDECQLSFYDDGHTNKTFNECLPDNPVLANALAKAYGITGEHAADQPVPKRQPRTLNLSKANIVSIKGLRPFLQGYPSYIDLSDNPNLDLKSGDDGHGNNVLTTYITGALSLKGCNLTEIPRNLLYVELLNLSDNHISQAAMEAAFGGDNYIYINSLYYLYLDNETDTNGEPVHYNLNRLFGKIDLSHLKELSLQHDGISDISPLARTQSWNEYPQNLEKLSLRGNHISDISSLAKFPHLRELYMADNQVSDVSGLKELDNLADLDLSGNRISDISPLAKLGNISSLKLDNQNLPNAAVSSKSDVSLPAARTLDGSAIAPTGLTPASGTYDAKTGIATWAHPDTDGTAAMRFSTAVTLGRVRDAEFSGTISQPYTVSAGSTGQTPQGTSSCVLGTNTYAQCFPDPALAEAVVQAVSKENHDVALTVNSVMQRDDTNEISTLSIDHTAISDLRGLSVLSDMHELTISNSRISDLTPLRGLYLSGIDLHGNQITDITPLTKVNFLSRLNLAHNRISDISALTKVYFLSSLNLGHNRISDITPLSGIERFSPLDLDHNPISDISTLSGHTFERYTDANYNEVPALNLSGDHIASLADFDMSNISGGINLSDNRLTDFKPAKWGKGVTRIALNNNRISDLANLASTIGNRTYDNLELRGNGIEDATPAQASALASLGADIGDSTDGSKHQGLHLEYNRLTSLAPFKGQAKIYADHNLISDLSPLTGSNTWYNEIHLAGNHISDISPLKTLNVYYIWLDGNDIVKLPDMSDWHEFATLSLTNNHIYDISAAGNYLSYSHQNTELVDQHISVATPAVGYRTGKDTVSLQVTTPKKPITTLPTSESLPAAKTLPNKQNVLQSKRGIMQVGPQFEEDATSPHISDTEPNTYPLSWSAASEDDSYDPSTGVLTLHPSNDKGSVTMNFMAGLGANNNVPNPVIYSGTITIPYAITDTTALQDEADKTEGLDTSKYHQDGQWKALQEKIKAVRKHIKDLQDFMADSAKSKVNGLNDHTGSDGKPEVISTNPDDTAPVSQADLDNDLADLQNAVNALSPIIPATPLTPAIPTPPAGTGKPSDPTSSTNPSDPAASGTTTSVDPATSNGSHQSGTSASAGSTDHPDHSVQPAPSGNTAAGTRPNQHQTQAVPSQSAGTAYARPQSRRNHSGKDSAGRLGETGTVVTPIMVIALVTLCIGLTIVIRKTRTDRPASAKHREG